MRTLCFALTLFPLLSACATVAPPQQDQGAPLVLKWQRLVDEQGETCQRCGLTESAVAEAETRLRPILAPLGLRLQVEKQALDRAAFTADPTSSNRVWVDGTPLETLLGGTVGTSRCCDSCGDQECRTVSVNGTTQEAIPSDWIVRGVVIAAAARLRGQPFPADAGAEPAPANECCSPGGSNCCSGSEAGATRK